MNAFFHEPKRTEQESHQTHPKNFLFAPLTDCQGHSSSHASRILGKAVLILVGREKLKELKFGGVEAGGQ